MPVECGRKVGAQGAGNYCSRAFLHRRPRRKRRHKVRVRAIPLSETTDIVQQIATLRCEHRELDQAIGDMLRKGAQVDLTEDQLTLATADKTLMFKRAE